MEFTVNLIKRTSLLIGLTMSLFSASAFAQSLSETAIAERIIPVGDVYLDGNIGIASEQIVSVEAAQPAGPRSGEKIYNTYCVACHGSGVLGAPMKGDAAAWEPRIAQGSETMLRHAINGYNSMPANGTCSDCTDDDIASTIAFLTKGLY